MAFELPEALHVARQMDAAIKGKRITRVHVGPACASLIRQGFINLDRVSVAKHDVTGVTSEGKWIFVRLMPDLYLLFALETGGKILYHTSQASLPAKFHIQLDFADGSFLTEQIVGWGWAKGVKESELPLQRYPGQLGLSPLDRAFTLRHFRDILAQHGNKVIKYVLIEQRSIAGLGNGYMQDILFRARLHPKRKAADITQDEQKALYTAIRKTLKEAVRLGSSEFERDLYDTPGRYKRIMGEHMKGKPCPECGAPIEKLSVLGTPSYVCPSCQK